MSAENTDKEGSSRTAQDFDPSMLRSTESFYCYSLEDKIVDLTGPIQQKAKGIRTSQPVNWQPYLKAELINKNDYTFITLFQKARTKNERKNLLDNYQNDAFKTFLKVVQRVSVVEEIQKVLVLIDDMLWEDMSRVHHFNEAASDPWKAFMDLLSCSDDFVRNLTSRIITKLFAMCNPSTADIQFFLNWLKSSLRNDNSYLLCVARCLQHLLRFDKYRLPFLSLNGLFRIIRILYFGLKPQAQYQFAFCIWVASFNVEISEKVNNYGVIQIFIELLECSRPEIVKLPRVILATFRNLLEKPREPEMRKFHALVMIQNKFLKFVPVLKARKKLFDDTELVDDYETIEKILNMYVTELSTFDEYKLEVKSGLLEWSVVHTSKPFWDENAHRLNENGYELLKILISLLEMSKDSIVLCVAAHDLSEYMTRYYRGKTLVELFGGKDALLKLLKHEDPSVKYHGLRALQILMLNSYDLLVELAGDIKENELPKRRRLTDTDLVSEW